MMGEAIGGMSSALNPERITMFFLNGALNRAWLTSLNTPPPRHRAAASTAYYMGRAWVTKMYQSGDYTDVADAPDDWFRWGVEVAQDQPVGLRTQFLGMGVRGQRYPVPLDGLRFCPDLVTSDTPSGTEQPQHVEPHQNGVGYQQGPGT